MRTHILLLVTVLFLQLTTISQADNRDAAIKPAVYGILFYADWCGSCKALDPKIVKAREDAMLDEKDILFVRLDLTDETTQHQSALMAAALGIEELYTANNGKTGFMLLLNAKTKKKIDVLTKTMESDEIAVKISDSIESANS